MFLFKAFCLVPVIVFVGMVVAVWAMAEAYTALIPAAVDPGCKCYRPFQGLYAALGSMTNVVGL